MNLQLAIFLILIYSLQTITTRAHGDAHERITELTHQLKHSPKDIDTLLERANLYREHKEYELANKDLSLVKKLTPQNSTRIFLHAKLCLDRQQWKLALTHLNQYLRIESKHTEAYHMRAVIHRSLMQPEKAAADLQKAIQFHQSAPASWSVALVNEMMKSSQFEEALRHLDGVLKHHSKVVSLHESRAVVLARLNRPSEAAEVYVSLRKLYPGLTLDYCYLEAELWQNSGRATQEFKSLNEALDAWGKLSFKKKNLESYKFILNQVKQRLKTLKNP